jgi:transposase InsO family protein
LLAEQRSLRLAAASFVAEQSLTLAQGAALLSVSPSSLSAWARLGDKPLVALGRPPARGTAEQRNAVLASLVDLGLSTGIPRLQALHPALGRRELREFVGRRRDAAAVLNPPPPTAACEWQVAGTVWAMDFTWLPDLCSPCFLEGKVKALVVRDLASQRVLALVPAASENAAIVKEVLKALIARFGPPLVLKSDNGSGFVAEGTADLRKRYGIVGLFSPPRTPTYNGAVEASNAWIKRDLVELSLRSDAPVEDLLVAVGERRNRTGRPWGAKGETPFERMRDRPPIKAERRERFMAAAAAGEAAARAELGLPVEGKLKHFDAAAVGRHTTRRALVELGYLVIRRRSISL